MPQTSSSPRTRPSPVAALWQAAREAQAAGDHRRAERLLATLVTWSPADAEAWFLRAVSAGWAAPRGHHRFDEVIVGMAIAVERELPGRRAVLRQRAARALTVLAEVRFGDSADMLDDPREDRSLRDHLAFGRATLRLLDAAIELDPDHAAAAEASLRVAEDVLATIRVIEDLDGAARLDDIRRAARTARDRARTHLAPLAA